MTIASYKQLLFIQVSTLDGVLPASVAVSAGQSSKFIPSGAIDLRWWIQYVAFSSSSQLYILSPYLLNDHDRKVFHGVSRKVEVGSYRFFHLFGLDIGSVAV